MSNRTSRYLKLGLLSGLIMGAAVALPAVIILIVDRLASQSVASADLSWLILLLTIPLFLIAFLVALVGNPLIVWQLSRELRAEPTATLIDYLMPALVVVPVSVLFALLLFFVTSTFISFEGPTPSTAQRTTNILTDTLPCISGSLLLSLPASLFHYSRRSKRPLV